MAYRPPSREKECDTCGSIYLVTASRLSLRNVDSIDCRVCGEELLSWNGAVSYEAELKEAMPWPPEPTSA